MATKTEQVPKTHGTARLTCRNHPTYRWTKTKYVLPGFVRTYMGAGVLMFEGEADGKPAHPFLVGEARLAEQSPEFQAHYREHYTAECSCPESDLQFMEWVD